MSTTSTQNQFVKPENYFGNQPFEDDVNVLVNRIVALIGQSGKIVYGEKNVAYNAHVVLKGFGSIWYGDLTKNDIAKLTAATIPLSYKTKQGETVKVNISADALTVCTEDERFNY